MIYASRLVSAEFCKRCRNISVLNARKGDFVASHFRFLLLTKCFCLANNYVDSAGPVNLNII